MNMKTAGVGEIIPKIDSFYQDCLNLLNEISIESLLNRTAEIAISVTNATYCVCGTTDEEDTFTKIVLRGFTQVELDLIHSDEEAAGQPIRNIHSDAIINIARGKDLPENYNIFPAKRPFISSLLYVPIFYGKEKMGSIILLNKIGAPQFDSIDQKFIEILARYAGFGINNTIIYERIANREQMLAKRNEDLALLNELAKISASSTENQDAIVHETMHQVMGYLDLVVGEVFLRDDDAPNQFKIVFKEGHNLPTSLFGFSTVQTGQGIVGKVAQSKRNYLLSEEELEIINQKRATTVDLNYVAILPLITSEGVVGVSCLGTKLVDEKDTLNLQFLSSISSWMATLIQDYRLTLQRKRVAILEERERISMDLHDGVIQSIYGVGLTLEHARILAKENPEKIEEQIQASIDALNATIRDIRSYIMDLKPARLTGENLIQSLRRLGNDFYSNTLVTTVFDPKVETLDQISEDYANAFYMICKEALANITKHAKATQVMITFTEETDRYVLIVQDNGSGFDPTRGRKPESHGINNMFARAENLGGKLEMTSKPGKGTKLEVWLPKTAKEG